MLQFFALFTLLSLLSPITGEPRQGEPTATPSPGTTVIPLSETPIETPLLSIQSPSPGQALRGNIPIIGSLDVQGFSSAELGFGYVDNPTDTWFLIQSITQPAVDSPLAQWDTTTISDGTYTLRLVVSLLDGSQIEQSIIGLRVRNYTPIETDTPTPNTPTAIPVIVGTATATHTATPIPPTATPFPQNPAQLTPQELRQSLGKGALAVFGLFALIGLYWIIIGRRR